MPKKRVKFRGQWYPSMAAAARAHGFEPNTLHKAKLAGRLDDVGKGKGYYRQPVRINGLDFPSIKSAAEHFRVHKGVIMRLLEKGQDTYTPKGIKVTVGRQEFDSIKACAEHFGVSRHRIYRLREAGNLDSLLPPKPERGCMNCGKPINLGTHLCDKCRQQSSGLAQLPELAYSLLIKRDRRQICQNPKHPTPQ